MLWQNQLQTYVNSGHWEDVSTATDRSLMDVLTDAQRRTLLDWVGEPYQSPSWQELRDKYVKRKR